MEEVDQESRKEEEVEEDDEYAYDEEDIENPSV